MKKQKQGLGKKRKKIFLERFMLQLDKELRKKGYNPFFTMGGDSISLKKNIGESLSNTDFVGDIVLNVNFTTIKTTKKRDMNARKNISKTEEFYKLCLENYKVFLRGLKKGMTGRQRVREMIDKGELNISDFVFNT